MAKKCLNFHLILDQFWTLDILIFKFKTIKHQLIITMLVNVSDFIVCLFFEHIISSFTINHLSLTPAPTQSLSTLQPLTPQFAKIRVIRGSPKHTFEILLC